MNRMLCVWLCCALALVGPALRSAETKAEDHVALDDILCSLNKAALPSLSAPTTLLKEEAVESVHTNALSVLKSIPVHFSAVVKDVRMEGKKTAKISYATPKLPNYDAIKANDKAASCGISTIIELPISKEEAMKIAPGDILLLRGLLHYERQKSMIDAMWTERPLVRVHYRAVMFKGASLYFEPASFSFGKPKP